MAGVSVRVCGIDVVVQLAVLINSEQAASLLEYWAQHSVRPRWFVVGRALRSPYLLVLSICYCCRRRCRYAGRRAAEGLALPTWCPPTSFADLAWTDLLERKGWNARRS